MAKSRLFALLIGITAAANPAQTETKKGPNGGMVVMSQGHPIEFLLKDQDIVFYLSDDDGSPLPTTDMQGRATVLDSGKTTIVPLQPAAPNMMLGKLQGSL